MKPFLRNKGFIESNDITFNKNKILSNAKELTKLFNGYYINIVERVMALYQKSLTQILKTPANSLLEILSILPKIIQACFS